MTDIKCVKAYIVKCTVIYTRWRMKDPYTNSKQGYFLTLRGAKFWQETQNCWPNGLPHYLWICSSSSSKAFINSFGIIVTTFPWTISCRENLACLVKNFNIDQVGKMTP